MSGQSLNAESNDSRNITGLTHVAKNTLSFLHASVRKGGVNGAAILHYPSETQF